MQEASNRPSTPNSSVFAGARSIASSLSSQLKASIPDPPLRNTFFDTSPASPDKKSESTLSNNNMAGRDNSHPPTVNQLQAPFTPRRMGFPGPLSLKMPSRGPLSPVLDPALGYSVARRPRLDFARACTSLHHSTLAEQPSPDSSPSTSTSFPIPRNNNINNINNKGSDSPIANHHYHHSSSHASSLGSGSMMDYAPSGDDSDSSSDEDLDVDLDLELGAPFTTTTQSTESAASISLMNHQKARLGGRTGRGSRHSSMSSASASNSSLASPSPTTPPVQSNNNFGVGYFGRSKEGASRRKDSLTTALRNSLRVGSRGNDDEKDRPDPIRRPVSRRGSLLPKTKTFQRIKAALQEEASPVDMEVKREAEITRQIREEEEGSPPTTTPAQPSMDQELSDIREEDESMGSSGENGGLGGNKGIGISFSKQAQRHGGFWFGDQMDGLSGSPPTFPGLRMTSDGDIMMNSESVVSSPIANVPTDMRRPKRRRTQDERFEPEFFKRRAVSPGLSHSPILATSPPLSGGNAGGKRLNFQGMSDTHDGIMKMSLQ